MTEPAAGYTPVDCGVHDQLEDLAVRRVECEIEHLTEDGAPALLRGRIADLFARSGEEFLRMEDGTTLRLDRLRSVRPATPARIHSLQVGLPLDLGREGAEDPLDRPWTTGLFKHGVEGRIALGRTNLAGDGQADLRVHGGPDKAVCVYPLAHYPQWGELLGTALPPGAFGENFTVEGQTEAGVCIGDVYAVGDALLEVSQPRGPCWKIARRWRREELTLEVQESGLTGWYLRVLRTGSVAAGDALALEQRPFPELSIARLNSLRYTPPPDPGPLHEAAGCPALAEAWRGQLRRLAESAERAAAGRRA